MLLKPCSVNWDSTVRKINYSLDELQFAFLNLCVAYVYIYF